MMKSNPVQCISCSLLSRVLFSLFVVNFSGEGGNVWVMDRKIKHKLRGFLLSLLEEDTHEPEVLTPAKAAKEAAKQDQLVNAARARVAEFESRASLVTAPASGAPPPAQFFAPQDSSPADAPLCPSTRRIGHSFILAVTSMMMLRTSSEYSLEN